MERGHLFDTASIPKLMVKMCVPAAVTILVMIVYNIADMFFVGQTGDAMQVAAVSLSAPVFSILSGLGTLIGSGGCIAIAVALGKKETQNARSMTSFCCYFSITIGIIFTVIMLVFMGFILDIIGTSPATRPYARQYLSTLYLGAPAMLFASVFASIVRANGAARESMIGNALGSITNIILDPLFILGLNLGVTGAAIATIIGNLASCIYFIFYLRRNKDFFSLNPRDLSFRPEVSWKILYLGLPSALGIMLMSISNMFNNNLLVSYGDKAVAASGVAGKISMVISMLQMGICMGIQPILAYFHGAANNSRIRQLIKTTAIVTVTIGTVLTIAGWIFKSPLITFFINDPEVLVFGQRMIIGNLIAGPVIGLFYLSTGYLQATEKAILATVTSLLRQGIIFIPVLYSMNQLFGLSGLIFSHAISDIMSTLIGICISIAAYKSLLKKTQQTHYA